MLVAVDLSVLQGKILWLADPKAMQYIYQPSGYKFQKLPERRAMSRLHSGHGLVWADGKGIILCLCLCGLKQSLGDVHKRQRRVMLPAFGAPESKALFPLFVWSAQAASIALSGRGVLATNVITGLLEVERTAWQRC